VIVFILISAYLFIPNKKILVNENINIYILPSSHSTVYNRLKQKHIVEIINEKNNFYKVLFKNNNIGWINKNDI
jgi:SH3-like domain-containing protein